MTELARYGEWRLQNAADFAREWCCQVPGFSDLHVWKLKAYRLFTLEDWS